LRLHVWFENFSTPAARAVHEIQIPFKVAVRSVCDQTRLNILRADKMYHKLSHDPGVQLVRVSDTMSQSFGNGYDVCGPRVYSIVDNPLSPDFENFRINSQNGL